MKLFHCWTITIFALFSGSARAFGSSFSARRSFVLAMSSSANQNAPITDIIAPIAPIARRDEDRVVLAGKDPDSKLQRQSESSKERLLDPPARGYWHTRRKDLDKDLERWRWFHNRNWYQTSTPTIYVQQAFTTTRLLATNHFVGHQLDYLTY